MIYETTSDVYASFLWSAPVGVKVGAEGKNNAKGMKVRGSDGKYQGE